MIRTKDINEKRKQLAELKKMVTTLGTQIDQDNAFLRGFDEDDFEYIVSENAIEINEKCLEDVQKKIGIVEQEIKVMKGEAEHVRVKPWEKERKEVGLECF